MKKRILSTLIILGIIILSINLASASTVLIAYNNNIKTITFTAVPQTTGNWGVTIQASLTGGCTFPSNSNSYQSVMLSDDGTTKTINLNVPSGSSCTFSGDYLFTTTSGNQALQNFNNLLISGTSPPINPTPTPTSSPASSPSPSPSLTPSNNSEGFCLQFADDILGNVFKENDCQTNSIFLIIGVIIIIVLIMSM
jgi:hypothetical protein